MSTNGHITVDGTVGGGANESGRRILDNGGGTLGRHGGHNDGEKISEADSRPATGGNIAIHADGRMLKVQATGNDPHLVSLGNDRFSTAVTVHPLPKGTVHHSPIGVLSSVFLSRSLARNVFTACLVLLTTVALILRRIHNRSNKNRLLQLVFSTFFGQLLSFIRVRMPSEPKQTYEHNYISTFITRLSHQAPLPSVSLSAALLCGKKMSSNTSLEALYDDHL